MFSHNSGHVTKSNVIFSLNKSIMRPHQLGPIDWPKGGAVIQARSIRVLPGKFFVVDLVYSSCGDVSLKGTKDRLSDHMEKN